MPKRLTAAQRASFDRSGRVDLAAVLGAQAMRSLRETAEALRAAAPPQDMLSGIHNAFGYHACPDRAWSFLDVAESQHLLDCVEDVLGPDIVLWDSELYLHGLALCAQEDALWPADPLAGIIAAIAVESGNALMLDIVRLRSQGEVLRGCAGGAWYVVRYMPGTSLFDRDPRSRANRIGARERPLINYAKRPLWLVRGEDRRGNDFATGFALPAARWVDAAPLSLDDPIAIDGA